MTRGGTNAGPSGSTPTAGRLRLAALVALAALAAIALAPSAVAGQAVDGAATNGTAADLDALAGDGTADDPYVITDVHELQAMERDRDAHYVLGSDVDASATDDWNEDRGFDPVGNASRPFQGTLDGSEHAISNLTIEREDGPVGLFGALGEDARVERLALERIGVEHTDIYEEDPVGALAARSAGEVREVSVGGTVHYGTPHGGLVGYNNGSVADAYVTADVEGRGDTGGVVGENHGTVERSYAVIPEQSCGGFGGCRGTRGGVVGDDANGTTQGVYWHGYAGDVGLHEGLDREALTGTDAVETMAEFDFGGTWRATHEYPAFAWQYDGPDLPGVGLPDQPFRIHEAAQLEEVRENRSAHYVLERDVNAGAIRSANGGDGLEPIGSTSAPFVGEFDGQEHELRNLTIHRPEEAQVGLIGVVGSAGAVRNVALVDANVTGDGAVGTLAGSSRGTVANVHADGTVVGDRTVGGLVGSTDGTVRLASSHADVDGRDAVGGLVGRNGAGSVSRAYAAGPVSGEVDATTGGLVGDSLGGVVETSYWDRDASGQADSAGSAVGLATEELTGEAARSTMDGLAFASAPTYDQPWVTTDGYPALAWRGGDPVGLPGSGTVEDPYLIDSATDLSSMRADLDAHYRLDGDVDAGASADWNDGRGLEPIGTASIGEHGASLNVTVAFEGTLDGDGHAIRDLTIDRGTERGVGLFAALGSNAAVRDLELRAANATGGSYVGALAGAASGTVENVTVTGDVRAEHFLRDGGRKGGEEAGGLVGEHDGVLEHVRVEATVTGDLAVGGVVGSNAGRIESVRASGSVAGTSRVGGIAGSSGGAIVESVADVHVEGVGEDGGDLGGLVGSNGGAVRRSAAHGSVDGGGAGNVGGLAGSADSADATVVASSYARGDVQGDRHVGGLVGYSSLDNELRAVYATGNVTGTSRVGGLVGEHVSGDVSAAYWDRTTSGTNASAAGAGLDTDSMTGERARETLEGFDFAETWRTTDAYPELVGQNATGTPGQQPGAPNGSEPDGCVATATVAGQTVCDSDGDGLFRDVDGDGDVTHADVRAFFDVQHRPAWKQPDRFDFNGNEVVGHGDVVALFQHVATQGL